jgi:hypothetical protein
MKKISICFLLLFSFSLFSQSKKSKIKLVQYLPYCGGAKPNKDLNNTPNKSVAYANKKLIFISDKQIIDTIITDKNGYLKCNLPNGIYNFYEPWKFYKLIPKGFQENNINMDCLKEEWAKEDLKMSVSKKTVSLANNLIYPKCTYQFPCLIKKHLPN